jgi:putative zinc finger protein
MMREARESMSHVDDGSLHAYLDGELSAVERTRIETHLTECAACRSRLDEERALIERAGQLLGLATPPGPEREMPPLHQLRHPRPRLRGMVPLAWAATVVLALGVGWYARGGSSVAGIGAANDAPALYYRDTGIVAAARAPETPPPARQAPAEATNSSRTPAREVREVREEAAQTQERERDDRAADALASRVSVARAEPPAGSGPPAPVRPFVPPPAAAGIEIGGIATTAEPKAISTDSARRFLGTTFALVPGLPVRRVRQQAGGPIEIEQQLDSGTVITLFQWPEETAAQPRTLERSNAPAPSARGVDAAKVSRYASERLARYVRGMRVEITGPIPVDSLSKLLERVH